MKIEGTLFDGPDRQLATDLRDFIYRRIEHKPAIVQAQIMSEIVAGLSNAIEAMK